MQKRWRIGTSGWNYKDWKGLFYPTSVPATRWLEYYAQHFDTIEVNATFYRLPKQETFDKWYNSTPQGFLWAVKASRFITHIKRLKDCEEPLERLYNAVKYLKEKMGPVLFQLPPSLSFEQDLLKQFLTNLDSTHRHVMEVRHPSWLHEDAFEILKSHNIAACISDTGGRYPYTEAITADFTYIRLHGPKKLYASKYSNHQLREWAKKIRESNMDAYIYFDNDFQGYAIENAKGLKKILYK
jgi:uncharacterized protein YecE (DUF72 family)